MRIFKNINEENRKMFLQNALSAIPSGSSILDAGAGELKNKQYCSHLKYTSQDFCEYKGLAGSSVNQGLQMETWDTSGIDLVSDITHIPVENESFDVVLCSEVLEHIPDPTKALDEFRRILKFDGVLILTAPFASNVHFAPYHFSSGFSKYWYEHHLEARKFNILELSPNGDWYDVLRQELGRLGALERAKRNPVWPLAYAYSLLGYLYFSLRKNINADDLACFGWHCIAKKRC